MQTYMSANKWMKSGLQAIIGLSERKYVFLRTRSGFTLIFKYGTKQW